MSASRTFRRYRGWIAVGVLIAIGVGAWFLLRKNTDTSSTLTYQTEAAAKGTLAVTVAGTGNLEVGDTTDVYPDAAGTVESIEVAEGDSVVTGTVLFTLDDADLEASTAQALASYRQSQVSVAQASSQLTKAKASYADLKDRYENPASPPATGGAAATVTASDLTAAKAEITAASASLAAAKAQRTSASLSYKKAQNAEEDVEVTSPVSGTVWSLDIDEGDDVSSGGGATSSGNGSTAAGTTGSTTSASSAPVVIAPVAPILAHLTVNEVDVPSLQEGQRADLSFDAMSDLTATGKVTEVSDSGTVSQGVVTFDVWVSLDVLDPSLREGMSVAATIVTKVARDALLVSNAAVKSADDDTSYVQVMKAGAKTPTKVTVETGLSSATQTEILSGLSEGDLVVTQTVDTTDDSTSSSNGGSNRSGAGFMMGGGPRQ